MVQLSSPATQILPASKAPKSEENHFEIYFEMVEAALIMEVERGVPTAALQRALRSQVGYDVINRFFQFRLREALRIVSLMNGATKNPVASWLHTQDSRVLQRLLHCDSRLDEAEVKRITYQLEIRAQRRQAKKRVALVA